jgi:hypothetical protein
LTLIKQNIASKLQKNIIKEQQNFEQSEYSLERNQIVAVKSRLFNNSAAGSDGRLPVLQNNIGQSSVGLPSDF